VSSKNNEAPHYAAFLVSFYFLPLGTKYIPRQLVLDLRASLTVKNQILHPCKIIGKNYSSVYCCVYVCILPNRRQKTLERILADSSGILYAVDIFVFVLLISFPNTL
jgi:hypothetical protein